MLVLSQILDHEIIEKKSSTCSKWNADLQRVCLNTKFYMEVGHNYPENKYSKKTLHLQYVILESKNLFRYWDCGLYLLHLVNFVHMKPR